MSGIIEIVDLVSFMWRYDQLGNETRTWIIITEAGFVEVGSLLVFEVVKHKTWTNFIQNHCLMGVDGLICISLRFLDVKHVGNHYSNMSAFRLQLNQNRTDVLMGR